MISKAYRALSFTAALVGLVLASAPAHSTDAFIDLSQNPVAEVQLDAQARQELSDLWPQRSQITLEESIDLHDRLVRHWQQVRQQHSNLSEKEFAERLVARGQVFVRDADLGVAELNRIDDSYFVRVVHQKSEITFMFIEEGSIDPESRHLRQYIARQHIDAGAARRDGQRGRDLVMIKKSRHGQIRPEEMLRFDRNRSYTSMGWWNDYWKATYKAPTRSTVGFGTACGLAQGALALCVAGLKGMIDPEAAFSPRPAMLSGAWGTGVGAYVSTYKNWTNRGSTLARTMKSSANGALFGYILVAITHPDGVEALNILDPEGALLNLAILGNVFANNLAKTHWNNFSRVREFSGISRQNFSIRLPGGRVWKTQVAQSAVENQAIYLAPFSIRLLDLLDFTIGSFPMGKFALWSSIPAVEYTVMKYTQRLANKTQHPKAIELYQQQLKAWNSKKKFLSDSRFRNKVISMQWARMRGQDDAFNKNSLELARLYPDIYEHRPLGARRQRVNAETFEMPTHIMRAQGSSQCTQALTNLLR